MNSEHYQIGKLQLNVGTQEAVIDGKVVPLPPLSFSLLLTLARHAPNVVTTQELEEEVWKGLVIDRGTINKRVVLVRNALKKAGCERDYIAVVRGTGYRLVVPVSSVENGVPVEQPAGVADPPQPHAVPFIASSGSNRLLWLATIGLAITVVMLLVTHQQDLEDHSHSTTEAVTLDSTQGTAPDFSGIAVLPFSNVSSDEAQAFFSNGVSTEIARILRGFDELEVVSGASVEQINSLASPVEIGAQLDVDRLLSGSVFRDESQIVIMVTLTDATDGTELWAEQYDRPIADLFTIQETIAGQVVSTLNGAETLAVPSAPVASNTANIDAFSAYLEGRALLDSRITEGNSVIDQALVQFRRAIELDPMFARAHLGMASAYFVLPSYAPERDAEASLQQAEQSARYALELDPNASDAQGVLAAILAKRGQPLQAAAMFEQSLAKGNRDNNVLHWHAMLFSSMGYFEQMTPVLNEAFRVDPLNELLGCSLAGTLNFSGQPEASLQVLNTMSRFDRRDLAVALASLYIGDYGQAREMLRGLELRMGPLPDTYADFLVDAFEFPARFADTESAFVNGVAQEQIIDLVAFEALLIMGSPRAFDLGVNLRGSYFEHRLPEVVWSNWGVDLRRDQRFKEWVKALNYDQYWRSNGWPDRCRPTGIEDFECI